MASEQEEMILITRQYGCTFVEDGAICGKIRSEGSIFCPRHAILSDAGVKQTEKKPFPHGQNNFRKTRYET